MSDVGAVKSFSLHNKRLAPNYFLGRTKPYGQTEHCTGRRMSKPHGIDLTETVAGAKNNIDEFVSVIDFAEPVRKTELRRKASLVQKRKTPFQVLTVNKQVHIFEVPVHMGVELERIAAT